MLKNYLKTAFRSFKNHKSSFLINLIGLSIGMASSILIFLWVMNEMNQDTLYTDHERIVQVMEHQKYSGNVMTTRSTPGILAPALKEEIPEFEYIATYTWPYEYLFTKGDKSLKESGIYARPDFFHILDIPLIQGNRDQLIQSPSTIAISGEIAERYFGRTDVVGESITLNGTDVHTIEGVFEKFPESASMQFDYILPFEDWMENNQWATQWGNNGPSTIAKIYPGVQVDSLNAKIKDYIKGKVEGESNVELFATSFPDLYLYGQFENGKVAGGRIEYVRLFTIVAIFILMIACINFMNLSTAKATKRAKEVGIRKSIGATKSSLVGQFLGESMIITFFSLLLSVFLVELSLPVFNDLTNKVISMNYQDPQLLLILLSTALVTGFIAGSYPAFYLSSFEAVQTLKGTIKTSAGEMFARKGLVVVQFALSVTLIISTIIVYQQIQFTQTKNLGYQKENLLSFPIEGNLEENWSTFKDQMESVPGVQILSRTGSSFLGRNSNTYGLNWPDKKPETRVLFENISVDYELLETMGMELVDGRAHSREFGADSARILINESAAEVMGLKDPVGTVVQLWGEDAEIIGLIKNFHFQHLRNEVAPAFFRLAPRNTWKAMVRLNTSDIQNTIAGMEQVFKEFNPAYPFDYQFMDDQYAALYRSEQRVGELARYFSIFAIIISCLGLFGLSAFTAEQRAKEIGVRKVLGASVQNLVLLLTKDFTKLVFISILISVPVSWWLMDQWVSDYAYHSQLQWWVFASAGILALLISWITVSWQSIKAAIVNPVQSLKSE